jgi:hypothetical protein
MTDDPRTLLWDAPPPPPRQPRPGEPLFEFIRASDHKRIVVELRFNGESYGWEAQLLEDGIDLFYSRGVFPTRALAMQWAEQERDAIATK